MTNDEAKQYLVGMSTSCVNTSLLYFTFAKLFNEMEINTIFNNLGMIKSDFVSRFPMLSEGEVDQIVDGIISDIRKMVLGNKAKLE